MKSMLLIVNPKAGKGTIKRKLPKIIKNFENMTVLQNVEYALTHNKEYKSKYTKEEARNIALKTLKDVAK